MGRLVKKTLADGSSIDYRYDKYGNLSEVDDGERPLVWRYDLMGRVTEEHQDWASNYFSYDALGQVESWQLPDANVLKYQRGRGGVLKQIDLNDSVLTQHLYQNGLEKERHQGAVISSFAHDEQGRLTYQQRSLSRQVTRKRDYNYDARGNLTHISDSKDGDIHFEYDPLSRLKAVRGNIEERFVHDATGNVLSQILGRHDDITEDKLGNAQGNQLAFHGDSHYEYDEFGRLMTEKRGKGQSLITTYEYDCQHRLIKASLPDGSVADYQYDAFGRRTHKTVTDKVGKATTTEYLWQGDNLIGETTNTEYQSYIYEPDTFKPLALLKGEGKDATPYYYHLDQIGTPTEITDVAGQSVWAVQYRAYGRVLTQQVEEIQSPLRFQGQYYDAETGLHYNRHRYYSPSTGRFTTADPIGLAGGLNNYQYVPNPTGWVDPLGLDNKATNCPGSSNAQGTLDRDVGMKLNDEIEGGVPVNHAGHHQVSIKIAQEYPVMNRAAELGYNINRGSNGIALPTDIGTSLETGLPLHTGRHLSARHEGSADALVHREMNALQRKYDRGMIDDSNLISEIGNIEDRIRLALKTNQVRLQAADPHWKPRN
ncbi:Cell wall-associated polypeptide CWBP200 [Vibrio spartinae]|uniref:Cell wall-associated polypeptide CWBP200 n=2 Tax=Vibrio spartinae TaxID=1918945 RepID=A0ABX6QZE0_9VIBR|nr:Cell wall-associated polypeptide CWBP200 [Vibrio spartinae]